MGILRRKNNELAKAKRAGKKPTAPRSGKAKNSSATKPAKSQTCAAARKRKRGADKTATGASTARVDKPIDLPKLSLDSGQDGTPAPLSTDAAVPRVANTVAGERRRWPERSDPAANYSGTKRAGSESRSESGESGNSPPRPNKLVPTNAVHLTERRIKRRMHKNGALMAAAGAALLGVLILSNQSDPPELVLGDRQTASRLPAGQDWQGDATSDTIFGTTSRDFVPDSNSPRITAPARAQFAARTDELSPVDIVKLERMLYRLGLAASAPDGVIGGDTEQAIRLYQEIAGLPVDGEATQDLLADMREVVKILDGDNYTKER